MKIDNPLKISSISNLMYTDTACLYVELNKNKIYPKGTYKYSNGGFSFVTKTALKKKIKDRKV